jgi:hypothetical protein
MKRVLSMGVFAAVAFLASAQGCSSGFPHTGSTARMEVIIQQGTPVGTRDKPLPLALDVPAPFPVVVRMLRPDGAVDTSFNGVVRLGVKPGTVQQIQGAGADGRNVKLTNGVSAVVTASVQGAFGETRFVAEDIGFLPVDPLRQPPPACSDGQDNDGDGLVDFPADPGCAFANDDTETGGGYVAGSSSIIYYALPRVADVRGVSQGGGATAFPKSQVSIDTGYNVDKGAFVFSTVVTRVASDGFYVTDVDDAVEQKFIPPSRYIENTDKRRIDGQKPRGYASVFAFTFNSPPGMRVCDRLKTYNGTSSDFFGFTEMGFPTWTLEEWDPRVRPCGVPEPFVMRADDVANDTTRYKNIAGLVRVITDDVSEIHVSKKLGPGDVPCKKNPAGTSYDCQPQETATNCDFNKDNKIDFTISPDNPEKPCSDACTADVECTEYSNFAARSAFQIVVTDKINNIVNKIQADGSASAGFNAVDLRGKSIKAFSGTLRYFSGGSQFTIEARCSDDIIIDLRGTVPPADKACVFPRSLVDLNENSQ